MIERGVLGTALRAYLPNQRWYSGTTEPGEVLIVAEELRREEWPALVWLLVDADGARYQMVLGLLPTSAAPDFLRGHDAQVLGRFDTPHGPAVAYDAVVDPELAVLMLSAVMPGEAVEHVRPIGTEQSNSSIVFDERLVMKLFRRVHAGPNPDVEVTGALARAGFPWVAPPLAIQSYEGDDDGPVDLAVVQPFLNGGVEAWALALTSLRGFFADHDTQSVPIIRADEPPPDPDTVGGDFSADSARLGETTAGMHLALAEAFGRRSGDPADLARAVEEQLGKVDHDKLDVAAVTRFVECLRSLTDAGSAIRVHGDLHLGQVMRTDAGWFVLDFEGEPARPLLERRRFWSPLRDVAGMCRSLSYASMVALDEQGAIGAGGLQAAALTWESRNRAAFLGGYRDVVRDQGLLPAGPEAEALVLAGFELERALYELAYEQAYRPAWVGVPLAGIERLLAAT